MSTTSEATTRYGSGMKRLVRAWGYRERGAIQLSRFLITTDLTESDGTGLVAVRLPGELLVFFRSFFCSEAMMTYLTPPVDGADFLAALEAWDVLVGCCRRWEESKC